MEAEEIEEIRSEVLEALGEETAKIEARLDRLEEELTRLKTLLKEFASLTPYMVPVYAYNRDLSVEIEKIMKMVREI